MARKSPLLEAREVVIVGRTHEGKPHALIVAVSAHQTPKLFVLNQRCSFDAARRSYDGFYAEVNDSETGTACVGPKSSWTQIDTAAFVARGSVRALS